MPDLNIPAVPAAPPTAPAKAPEIAAPKGSAKSSVPGSGDTPKAAAPVAASPAEKAVIQKIKLGDTEYDENILLGMIEKAKGADKKFLEAAQIKKQNMLFLKLAKENPTEFLRKTGLDPKKYAYDQVAEDLKNQMRDPKEVELEAAQKRLQEYEAKEKAEKERLKAEDTARKAKAWEARLNREIIDALEATPALPKTPQTVAKIAKYMAIVHEKTGVLLSPADIVSTIEKDTRSELGSIVKGATYEQLLALVGEEAVATLRKGDLDRLKDPLKNGKGNIAETDTDGTRVKPRKYRTSHEYWRSIDEAAKAERAAQGGR